VRHDKRVAQEPESTEHKHPVIRINDRGLTLGQDPAGRWIVWDQHNTVWAAEDRLLWLLPLLERPPEHVTQTIAATKPDHQLLPALLRYALISPGRYWPSLALDRLEAGYPSTDLIDALSELKASPRQGQPLRHRALRLWRKATRLQSPTT
jgi:hypothetical protein